MRKDSVILFGVGGHAQSCIDVIEQQGKFKISGLVGKPNEVGMKVCGYEVIASDKEMTALSKEFANAFIAVGQIRSPEERIRLYKEILAAGFMLPKFVSPFAYVSPLAQIGRGTIVMHAAVINSNTLIGENCIINSRSLVEHGTQVGNHSHVSTGVILNGSVSVGMGTFIGSGTVVKEGVSIGERSLVGMGVSLRRNLDSGSNYLGNTHL